MSVIRILPEDVSNRIAAGEVVERPASIVKELIENSLDADARTISIHIQRGGRTSIRVDDDGVGMDAEDALLCLEAHATSKIRSADDIEKIGSLGFRGEAIPSIASISRFELRTRPRDADVGTEVLVHGGVIRDVTEAGCPVGTSITARNIFYNTPARRKFLRSVATEEFHITETTLLSALAHSLVGFQLHLDKKVTISVQPDNDPYTRAAMLLGKDTMGAMLPVDYSADGITVTGFVARPGLTRSSRREQRAFVNGRPIQGNTIYYAIRDAYHTLIMKGRFAPTILFVSMPPESVDINVHPAKREVRFRDDRHVGGVIAAAIRQALRGLVNPTTILPGPERRSPAGAASPQAAHGTAFSTKDLSILPPLQQELSPLIPPSDIVAARPAEQPSPMVPSGLASQTAPPSESPGADAGTSVSVANRDEISRLRVLGAAADLFLVAEGSDGIVLIDQHAAHERVMFEKVLRQMRKKDGTRQGLLMPITIELSSADAKIVHEYLGQLQRVGFDIEDFGGNTIIVNAVPAHFPQENIVGMLRDIIDQIQDSPTSRKRFDNEKIAKMACKAAVKAHDHLAPAEIDALLRELINTELPYTCPHGRPTMINISYKELEKRFGRRQ